MLVSYDKLLYCGSDGNQGGKGLSLSPECQACVLNILMNFPQIPYSHDAPVISWILSCFLLSHHQIFPSYPPVFLLSHSYTQFMNRSCHFQLNIPFKSPHSILIPLKVFIFNQELYLTNLEPETSYKEEIWECPIFRGLNCWTPGFLLVMRWNPSICRKASNPQLFCLLGNIPLLSFHHRPPVKLCGMLTSKLNILSTIRSLTAYHLQCLLHSVNSDSSSRARSGVIFALTPFLTLIQSQWSSPGVLSAFCPTTH